MHLVHDTRPSADLSDPEVVAYLFQAARAKNLRTLDQLKQESERLFPDMSEERRKACFIQLGRALDNSAQ